MKTFFKIILVLLVIILTGLASFYFYHNIEKKLLTDADRKGTSGSYVRLGDGVTHYELAGPDTGRVVVLLHGFTVPHTIWNGTFEYLARQGFRVLRYDDYGRGFSDRPDVVYNKETYYNQLTDLLQKLKITKPVNIMGISFGGVLATDFAGNFPALVDKVILIDPGYSLNKPKAPVLFTRYNMDTHPDERANSQLEDFKYPGRHPNWVSEYKVQMQYKGFDRAIVSTLYNYNFAARESNKLLNTRHKQVLLIWGKEDHTVPFKYSDSVRSVLHTEFLPVDDAGHLPYLEHPEKVNPVITAFLKK